MGLTREERSALGPEATELGRSLRGRGAQSVGAPGYRGRTGIYELLVMDEDLRAAVQEDASASKLEKLGLARGMRLLKDDGLRLIREGVTTVEEVLRVANV